MSLINEALKKAQRLRNEDVADPSAPPAASANVRIAKRGKAQSANTMVLLGTGAVVLVILSVVLTVFLVNRSPAPAPPAPVAPTPQAAPTPAPEATLPVSVPVPVTQPTATVAAEPKPAEPATTPAPTSAPTPLAGRVEPAPGTTPAPLTPTSESAPAPAAPSAPASADPRVMAFVEAIRVTGIRSSGSESRVLMNDRVYRVNDLVDRPLGVRLIKVAAESLTFSDPNGINYVKNF